MCKVTVDRIYTCVHTYDIFIYFSFIEICSGGFEAPRDEICPFKLLWLLAFTTAGTTIAAVM